MITWSAGRAQTAGVRLTTGNFEDLFVVVEFYGCRFFIFLTHPPVLLLTSLKGV